MYFVMESQDPLGKVPKILKLGAPYMESWLRGARFAPDREPPNPLPITVNTDSPGDVLLDFYQAPAVLMSKRLVEILQGAGVDNLDVYPAVITETTAGKKQTYDTHVAVNIIGRISAADLKQTEFDSRNPDRLTTASIDRLGVDEAAARRQLLFRLAENALAVLVHESVKAAVEGAEFEGVDFTAPPQWSSVL